MDNVARVSTVFDVCFPENRTQILWRTTNRGHGSTTAVVLILEIIFRLSEIDDLDLSRFDQELVGRFEISMSHTYRLQVAHGADDADNHLLQLLLRPVQALLLSLPEKVLQICP